MTICVMSSDEHSAAYSESLFKFNSGLFSETLKSWGLSNFADGHLHGVAHFEFHTS